MASSPYKILFVCLGNICRSPAAENVLSHQLRGHNLTDQVQVDSAGTADYHVGKGPDPRMTAALQEAGYSVTGSAKQVTVDDLKTSDLVLAMDRENLGNIQSLTDDPELLKKVRLCSEFCTEHDIKDVPDPYYGEADGFREVIKIVEDASARIISSLPSLQS